MRSANDVLTSIHETEDWNVTGCDAAYLLWWSLLCKVKEAYKRRVKNLWDNWLDTCHRMEPCRLKHYVSEKIPIKQENVNESAEV